MTPPPHGTFPKIHPTWYRKRDPSLNLMNIVGIFGVRREERRRGFWRRWCRSCCCWSDTVSSSLHWLDIYIYISPSQYPPPLALWNFYRVSHPTLLSPAALATVGISDRLTPNQVGLFEPGRDLSLHEQDFCAKRDLRNFFGGQHPKHHHYIGQDHLNMWIC